MRKYLVFIIILPVFFLDRLTKILIIRNLEYLGNIPVTSFFSIVHAKNAGGAFSLLSQYPFAKFVFTFFPVLIAAGIVYAVISYRFSVVKQVSLVLILSGALGNLYDRFFHNGLVIDFLDIYYRTYHWPAFNVADISISCGIGLWLYAELFLNKKKTES